MKKFIVVISLIVGSVGNTPVSQAKGDFIQRKPTVGFDKIFGFRYADSADMLTLRFSKLTEANAVASDDPFIESVPGPDPSITAARGWVSVPFNCDRVWKVIVDFDHYDNWMPNVDTARYLGKDKQGRDLLETTFTLSVFGTQRTVTANTLMVGNGLRQINSEQLEGFFDSFSGGTLIESGSKGTCNITTWVGAKVGLSLPQFVKRKLIRDFVRDYLNNLRRVSGE